MSRSFDTVFESYIKQVNSYLENSVRAEADSYGSLAQAMRYSLLAGGKRIRPVLVLEFCRICGGNPSKAIPVAAAIEMVHTYSLIHDDLPCMDNDELRRGRPTNHIVYGECTATLAGDALQAYAFSTLLRADLPAERLVSCARTLADAAGLNGMCGGQFLDMAGEGQELSEEQLTGINDLKTGALLSAACLMGAEAAGATGQQLDCAAEYGRKIGLAFQIRDDMLDAISTTEQLGKPIGSDSQENKNTYMALLGEDKCAFEVNRLTEEAVAALEREFTDPDFLRELAISLAVRQK